MDISFTYSTILTIKGQSNLSVQMEDIMRKSFLIFSTLFLMALVGCESNILESVGDDSSKEASLEEAKMALDDGNYQKAINALSGYKNSTDPEVAGVLSSAYMGKAGLDLTYLLENIDEENDNSNFDIIASAFHLQTSDQLFASSSVTYKAATDATPRTITRESVLACLENLYLAKGYLQKSIDSNPDNDDLIVQMGLVSALHFIFDIGYVVAAERGSNIPINEAAYTQLFPKTYTNDQWTALGFDVSDALTSPSAELSAVGGDIEGIRNDLGNVFLTVKVFLKNLGADEEIYQDFNEFMTEILGLPVGSGDASVEAKIDSYSGTDLVNFIRNELAAD